jgi:hypothetical protein
MRADVRLLLMVSIHATAIVARKMRSSPRIRMFGNRDIWYANRATQ